MVAFWLLCTEPLTGMYSMPSDPATMANAAKAVAHVGVGDLRYGRDLIVGADGSDRSVADVDDVDRVVVRDREVIRASEARLCDGAIDEIGLVRQRVGAGGLLRTGVRVHLAVGAERIGDEVDRVAAMVGQDQGAVRAEREIGDGSHAGEIAGARSVLSGLVVAEDAVNGGVVGVEVPELRAGCDRELAGVDG